MDSLIFQRVLHCVPVPPSARQPHPQPLRPHGGRKRSRHCSRARQNRQESSGIYLQYIQLDILQISFLATDIDERH